MQAKTGSTENHKRYSNVNTLYHIASGLFLNKKFSYNHYKENYEEFIFYSDMMYAQWWALIKNVKTSISRSPANIPLVVEQVDTNDA